MKRAYLPLIIALAVASAVSPAMAQQQDTGASGVIDGSDVYQFLNSGSIIDGTRMEEASRKFDSAIKMPDRVHQCKSWQEVIDRDRNLQQAGVGATIPGDGTANKYQNNCAPGSGCNTASGCSTGYGAQGTSAKPKQGFFHKLKDDFIKTSEWVGFPISDEPLPGDVDASLAGDLPAGPDPRVYVHETKQAAPRIAPSAYNRQGVTQEEQPPTVIVDECDSPPTR